jgi:integrase
MIDLKGVHRVKMKLADGTVVEYHRAWRGRGAPTFWKSTSTIPIGGPQYLAALAKANPLPNAAKGLFREIIIAFLDSADFKNCSPRYQKDMRTSFYHPKNGIDVKFGDAPKAAFNDARIRGNVLIWRDKIGGKVGDDRFRHLQRLVGFALDRTMLTDNRLIGVPSIYHSNRAEIFWTPDEIETFVAGAPDHVSRIVIAATESGLRPADLAQLSRQHIHPTPRGQRIVIWTQKRKRLASIPVTARMARLIAETPPGQNHIIVNKGGQPYKHENYLGDAVSTWRDLLSIRKELRLYDARGTAATRPLEAGAEIKEIATFMGWSIKHAAEVIERCVALSAGMTDALAEKLEKAETRTKL